MKKGQGFLYFLMIVAIYTALFGAEVFFCSPLVEMLGNSFVSRMTAYGILLIVVNPIVTYYAAEKVPFRPLDLSVEGGLKETLKKEVELTDSSN